MFLRKLIRPATNLRKMSAFKSKINPVDGELEWVLVEDDYDYAQQIARSAYADMLHDTERNEKYYAAIKKAVAKVHQEGKEAIVLDIGTGTGLLAMMAVRSGAEFVYACEAFKPMSEIASEIIRLNGCENKIQIIPKRSTELKIGTSEDMPYRANILVTEVFDTELIGEGAITTFNHAHQELLVEDCIVVPSSASVYVQVFESDLLRKWNKFEDIKINDNKTLCIPKKIKQCPGLPSVFDLQLSQLPASSFQLISPVQHIFQFDWNSPIQIDKTQTNIRQLTMPSNATADGVFMWWSLVMDTDGEIILNCAPNWARNDDEISWRDHWMQAVFYFQSPLQVEKLEKITLISNYDEYSLWFNVQRFLINELYYESTISAPACNCGMHLMSRNRVGMLNDTYRNSKLVPLYSKSVSEGSVVVCIGNNSLTPLVVALLGADKVYCIGDNCTALRSLNEVAEYNGVEHKLTWCRDVSDLKKHFSSTNKMDLIIADPNFSCSILPWDNFYLWYTMCELKKEFEINYEILPRGATLNAVVVEFDHLWKIKAPVENTLGFDLTPFDRVIQKAIKECDEEVDAQPLWEYPCTILSNSHELMSFNFTEPIPEEPVLSDGFLSVKCDGMCNGVVLWLDWIYDDNVTITTGPIEKPSVGEKFSNWDKYSKQGVYLMNPKSISKTNNLKYDAKFLPKTGNIRFNFEICDTIS